MLYTPFSSKQRILAQKSSKITKKTIRWLVVVSSIPLFGIVTAFGIAPNSISFEEVQVEEVVQDLSIPEVLTESQSNQTFWHQDTITTILNRLDISNQDSVGFLQAARGSRAMRQLKPGETIHAQKTADGELLMLRYFFGNEELFLMEKTDDEFKMTDNAGIPNNIAMQLTDIFASEIDFYRDLRQGDRFTVVYETFSNNGKRAKTGRVLAVEFVNKGKSHQAIYFKASNGADGYYTPAGESLRKAFLLSPLTFSRVSSGFTNARYHPILKEWRAHRGIDCQSNCKWHCAIFRFAKGLWKFSGAQT